MMASIVVVCCHLMLPILPQFHWLIPLFTLLLLLRSFKYLHLLVAVMITILTLTITFHWYSEWHVSANYDYQNYIIQGEVLSASDESNQPEYIELLLQASVIGKDRFYIFKPKLLLRWYKPAFVPKQGNHIKVFATIKPLGGFANPGKTFNAQKYQTARAINKIAVIKKSPSNAILESNMTIRQGLIEKLNAYPLLYTRWLLALGIGYRDNLQNDDWAMLQASSTAHLFSISGMHLALVAGYVIWLSRALAPVFLLFVHTQRQLLNITRFIVVLGCYGYLLLAGGQVPVIRAFCAVFVIIVCAYAETPTTSYQLFVRVIFIACLLFPLSLMSSSFWLSFGAVLLLLIALTFDVNHVTRTVKAKLFTAYKVQSMFYLVGLPLSFYLWQQHTFLSLIANMVLIPLIGILILPLLLVALVIEMMGLSSIWLLIACDFLMHVSVQVIAKLSQIQQHFDTLHICIEAIFILAVIAVLVWQRWRMVSLSMLLLCCLWAQKLIPQQRVDELVFFEVGHGNSAVFTHQDGVMLFDFARGNEAYSLLSREILPYLKSRNINQIDLAILSHFDSDHAGGLHYLLKHNMIKALWSPRAQCIAGKRLAHADVSVQVLWPIVTSVADRNEESCVVLLTVRDTNILFAGDISASEEQAIMQRWPNLNVDILVAPHHGSKSSSSESFVSSLVPDVVVFSTSFPNHWGHPHEDVVQRYQHIGAKIYHLGESGALKVNWQDDKIKLTTAREDLYNRWYYTK
ncbi:MAG: DNA internalization-related competence protein ComEC/Rec2 [Pseudomonadota bacterium]